MRLNDWQYDQFQFSEKRKEKKLLHVTELQYEKVISLHRGEIMMK